MENHMVRQSYGRRPVVNKKRRRAPGQGSGGGLMPLIARQLLICSLLFLLIILCKGANLTVTNYVTDNVRYVLGHHVELKSVFNYVEKLTTDIRDSITPGSERSDPKKNAVSAGTEKISETGLDGTASVSGTGPVSENSQNRGNTPVTAETRKADGTQPTDSTQSADGVQTTGTQAAGNNAVVQAAGKSPSSDDITGQETLSGLQEDRTENTAGDDVTSVNKSMPESSVLSATSEEAGESVSGMILPAAGTVSSYFGSSDTAGTDKTHMGIDLSVTSKCDVKAVLDGKVTEIGASPAYGNYIRIRHEDNLQTVYANCSALYVNKGSIVKKGDAIAAIGGTGAAVGIHLHFEVWKDGKAVNPLEYLDIRGQ